MKYFLLIFVALAALTSCKYPPNVAIRSRLAPTAYYTAKDLTALFDDRSARAAQDDLYARHIEVTGNVARREFVIGEWVIELFGHTPNGTVVHCNMAPSASVAQIPLNSTVTLDGILLGSPGQISNAVILNDCVIVK